MLVLTRLLESSSRTVGTTIAQFLDALNRAQKPAIEVPGQVSPQVQAAEECKVAAEMLGHAMEQLTRAAKVWVGMVEPKNGAQQ